MLGTVQALLALAPALLLAQLEPRWLAGDPRRGQLVVAQVRAVDTVEEIGLVRATQRDGHDQGEQRARFPTPSTSAGAHNASTSDTEG